MGEAINGMLYMIGKYFALLSSMAFAGTTVLCYMLGVMILSKVINKLFSLISREFNGGADVIPVGKQGSKKGK